MSIPPRQSTGALSHFHVAVRNDLVDHLARSFSHTSCMVEPVLVPWDVQRYLQLAKKLHPDVNKAHSI